MRAGGPRLDSLDYVQYGLHYGVVCQNQDPDNLDRIKVRLPFLDFGDVDQTHWAQLMTPMEGNKFGWYAIPDIDDVVVVMFVAGDIAMPIILGGVWSTPDFSPETNEDGQNNFRGYRSRAGHRLILDDSPMVKVVVADKTTKNMFGVGNFAQAGAGPNVCAVYKPPMSGDTGVSISSMEGTMEITCPNGKLSVNAEENIYINAKTTIDIKAGGDLTMEASSQAKLTSASVSNYDGSPININ